MEYRFLGDTGLRVSSIGYGFMDVEDQSPLDTMIPIAYKLGINFFDCAEVYGHPKFYPGMVESLFGNTLKKLEAEREDLVVTTKLFTAGSTPNKVGLSYKHVVKGMESSLKRLQLDYVDVVFAHRDDPLTPMEEICRGFNTLIENGQAFYWATSEWSADRILEAFAICDRLGLIRPIADQPEYHMLKREKVEKEFANLFANYKYGSTVWSPLAGGLLTGKYMSGTPEDSRLAGDTIFKGIITRQLGPGVEEKTQKSLIQLNEISKEVGCSMSQLALAWVLNNRDVSTAIIGSRKPAQLEENIKALEFVKSLTPEVEEKIEQALGNRPESGVDFRTWAPLKPRRVAATSNISS